MAYNYKLFHFFFFVFLYLFPFYVAGFNCPPYDGSPIVECYNNNCDSVVGGSSTESSCISGGSGDRGYRCMEAGVAYGECYSKSSGSVIGICTDTVTTDKIGADVKCFDNFGCSPKRIRSEVFEPDCLGVGKTTINKKMAMKCINIPRRCYNFMSSDGTSLSFNVCPTDTSTVTCYDGTVDGCGANAISIAGITSESVCSSRPWSYFTCNDDPTNTCYKSTIARCDTNAVTCYGSADATCIGAGSSLTESNCAFSGSSTTGNYYTCDADAGNTCAVGKASGFPVVYSVCPSGIYCYANTRCTGTSTTTIGSPESEQTCMTNSNSYRCANADGTINFTGGCYVEGYNVEICEGNTVKCYTDNVCGNIQSTGILESECSNSYECETSNVELFGCFYNENLVDIDTRCTGPTMSTVKCYDTTYDCDRTTGGATFTSKAEVDCTTSYRCEDPTLSLSGCYTSYGSFAGDPHINAFGGGHFDFIGIPNKIFNFISDEYFSLNVYLVQVGLEKYKQFTYIGDIGIVVGEDKLLIPAVKEDVYYLNDVKYNFGDKNDIKLVGDCGIVGDHKFIIHGYELYIEKTDKTKHNIETTLHHNVKIVYDEEGRRETKKLPHGVVGQTADFIPRNETYNIEGKEIDYLIESDDIFDTKFKYSKYNGEGCSEEMKNKIDNLIEKRNNNEINRNFRRGMISSYSIIDDSYSN